MLEGRVNSHSRCEADPQYSWSEVAQKLAGYRTILGVPLLREGNPIGVMALTRSEVRPFTDKQIDLVTTFADQAVIAIENVRLFDEVQARTRELSEALEQQTATSEVLQVISRSPGDLGPVFQAMLENATRICEANFGNLHLREDDAFRVAAMHNPPPALRRWPDGATPDLSQPARTPLVAWWPPSESFTLLTTPRIWRYKQADPAAVSIVELAEARTLLPCRCSRKTS